MAAKLDSKTPPQTTTATEAPSEAELRQAFKTRAQRIVDALAVQMGNAEKLLKTKKAKPSPGQEAAFRQALTGLRKRLDGVISGAPQSNDGIPDQ